MVPYIANEHYAKDISVRGLASVPQYTKYQHGMIQGLCINHRT